MKNQIALALLGTAVLTACNNDSTPSSVNSVSGTVVEQADNSTSTNLVTKAWTGGAGQVKVVANSSAATVLATGTLNSNGTFTVNLPNNVDVSQVSTFDNTNIIDPILKCTGNLVSSNNQLKLMNATFDVTSSKDGTIAPQTWTGTADNSHFKGGALIYADRKAKITGSLSCSGLDGDIITDVTITTNMSLNKGWNTITYSLDGNISKSTQTVKSGSLPTNKWVFDQNASINGLKAQSHLPKLF